MPFILIVLRFIWRHLWLRYTILLAIGFFIYLGGLGEIDEAKTYQDGPKAADVTSLSEKNLEYDYLEVTGLNDSYYSYSYYSEAKDEEKADTDKAVVLYYPLLVLEEFDTSIAGEQSRPTVIVRQVLPQEQRACIETDSCLAGGEMTLEGRLSKDLPYSSDKEAVAKLIEGGLYTVDANTLYFDADWKPSTVSSGGTTKNIGLGWMLLTALSLPLTLFLRRRKAAQPSRQAEAVDSSLAPQEQS
jgi:hypothetical protein